MTHVELGTALGVTGATVGQWEGGKKEPRRLALIVKLAKLLHTTPEWLAFGARPLVYTKEHANAEEVLVEAHPTRPARVVGKRGRRDA